MGNKSSGGQNEKMAGFRVKEIRKLSPAAKCGLLLSSDYILSANGRTLKTMDPSSIAELIKSNEDQEVRLKVFNENTCKIRDVTIVPSKDWPGEGLLGVVLRLETYDPYMRTSTGDFNITLEDVYAKENPIARRSAPRQPAAGKQAAGGATPGDQPVSGVNAYSQHNSPDSRGQGSAKKRPTLGAL